MSEQPTPSRIRSIFRSGLRVTGTALFIGLSVGLVLIGSNLIAARAVNVEVTEASPPTVVETALFTFEDSYTVPADYIGQIEAARQVDLGFETGGIVAEMLVEEGQVVSEGAAVATLDLRSLNAGRAEQMAALEALRAQLALAQNTAERQSALRERGFASNQAFDETRFRAAELTARIAATEAAIDAIDISLEKSVLVAPFDGTISARLVDPGAIIGGGQPVLQLNETDIVQVRVGLSPELARGLKPPFEIRVGAKTFGAELLSVRPDIDPATRTQPALFAVSAGANVPLGQVATLSLTQKVSARGGWVPTSALKEGRSGLWSVLTVNQDSQIAPETVELIYADETRAFVRGTIWDGARFVTQGTHRVGMGETVALAGE